MTYLVWKPFSTYMYAILKKRLRSFCPYPLQFDLFRPPWPDVAHAPQHIVRSSSRFIDCHRRVSIINHLYCNRTAPWSDTEAPGRFPTSAYNSRTAKSFQSTAPQRQWKCVVLQSAAIYPLSGKRYSRGGTCRRETDEITEADWRVCGATHYIALHTRCIIQTLRTNGEMPDERSSGTLLARIIFLRNIVETRSEHNKMKMNRNEKRVLEQN